MLHYIKKHLPVALILSMLHFFFLLIIQLENYWFYVFDELQPVGEFFAFCFNLACAQHENIAVSLCLGLVYFCCAGSLLLRLFYFFVSSVIYCHIVIDQINYKLFFSHALPSMMDEGTSGFTVLLDSVLSEIDVITFINLVVLSGIFIYTFFLVMLQKKRVFLPKTLAVSFLSLSGFYALVLFCFYPFIQGKPELFNLNKHLYVDLIKDSWSLLSQEDKKKKSRQDFEFSNVTDKELYQLKYGKDLWPNHSALSQLAVKLKKQPQQNVIFIVLESVGAEQILPKGSLSPELTPNLYKYVNNMAIFNAIYTAYPATSRSHSRMNTGGYAPTWGPIKYTNESLYTGPTLAKEFKQLGFNSALFSAGHLNFGNIEHILKSTDYDHYFHFGMASESFKKKTKLNSWGGDEDAFREKTLEWIKQQDKNTPFFVHFLSSSTHHPYSIPKGYKGPFKGNDRKSRYYNALHYNDKVLGQLIADLKAQGLFENTTIAITGDHGQAFGKRHSGNMTHKNYLYEENIKNFLILLDSKNIKQTLTSNRHGKMADILPTLVGLHSKKSLDVIGQDLLSDDYQQKLIFFHKLAAPAKWGLIDGRWKFIAKLDNNEPQLELYDLISDPLEKKNRASEFSSRVQDYQSHLLIWYNKANEDMLQRIDGHKKSMTSVKNRQLSKPGPNFIEVGYKNDAGTFHQLSKVHPEQRTVAYCHWLPFGKNTIIKFVWSSPSKKVFTSDFEVKEGWDETWVKLRAPLPKEQGLWNLDLFDGDEKIFSQGFEVSDDAALFANKHPKVKSNTFAYKNQQGKFYESQDLYTDKTLAAKTSWANVDEDKSVLYLWTSPEGQKYQQTFKVKKGWHTTWVSLKAPLPLAPGKWSLKLFHEDKKLLEMSFFIRGNQEPDF